jgi:hypothetical protein
VIENAYLKDYDEDDRALEVGLSGDILFLSVGKWDPATFERTFTTEENASVGVPVLDLVNIVKVLAVSQHRDDIVRALGTDRDIRAVGI